MQATASARAMRLPGASVAVPVTSSYALRELGERALPRPLERGRSSGLPERRRRRSGNGDSSRIAAASAIGSSGGTSRPVRPSCTSSSAPPAAAAAAGSPEAAASRITWPNVSVVLGKQNTSALA